MAIVGGDASEGIIFSARDLQVASSDLQLCMHSALHLFSRYRRLEVFKVLGLQFEWPIQTMRNRGREAVSMATEKENR